MATYISGFHFDLPEQAEHIPFGASMSFDSVNDTIAIGACVSKTDVNPVYVYTANEANFTLQQEIVPEAPYTNDEQAFGFSVSISGDTLFVGAPYADDQGRTYVFDRSGVVWSQVARLHVPNLSGNDEYAWAVPNLEGLKVRVMGDVAFIWHVGYGGIDLPFRGGSFRVFKKIGGIWTSTTQDISSHPSGL